MPPRHAPAEQLVGSLVGGRYRIIQLLGSGGSGHVYLAELAHSMPPTRRGEGRTRVALKMMRAEHAVRPELVARFQREAAAAARIEHPNVVRVVASEVQHEGEMFFATELLVGMDLADTLAFSGKLAPSRAARIALGAAHGLEAAHGAGVIHRDVKPENIFLVHAPDGKEEVKLVDFGFSWLPDDASARPRTVVGTPEYMAPEQAQGAPPAPSADIYSLGVVLYEMLSGRVPFTGPYPAIALRHAQDAPARLVGLPVSPELEAVVLRALEKKPDRRFSSMTALAEALLAALKSAA